MWSRGTRLALPGHGLGSLHRTAAICDAFGRCWRLGFGDGHRGPQHEPATCAEGGKSSTDDLTPDRV